MRTQKTCPVMVGVTAFWVLGFADIQPAAAEFPAQNVALYSQIDLATFGVSSGNDCWGYVSPSGREYALMGLANKVAFVDITDPANPVWFASIAHASNIWGDIKVHAHVAYIVTERSGTGIQVIDMSDIDNHVVSLVGTITSPDRNHNLAIDTDSGYLYTCGSRGGSATTVIFDLSNPTNPVQVGTWQGAYEHDVQVVTYTSGPYAGRQIMFGASEERGLDIVDVTDKSNTFLMSRTPYPNVAYCHQVWTGDLKYLYVNDELDSISRTTVFDISDLQNPTPVGEFSSGLNAIDHNNYVRGGFLYEANYRSGLRIYDVGSDPVNPPQVGWFDTYPANDNAGFDGAWSCYPFFPSGTVIISDINRGLFIVDVSEAIGLECDPSCDDGLFCNGLEICQAGVCRAADEKACPGQLCNEDTDECVQCLSVLDCDDDVFCNGAEVCDGGACGSGAAPCPKPFCLESERRCVACLEESDCETDGFCQFVMCGEGGVCVNEPRLYGDGNRDGMVDLLDILCMLNGFQENFELCSYEDLDIAGCESVGEPIDLEDILAVLDAFEGLDRCCGG